MAARNKREDPLCVIVCDSLAQSDKPAGQWVPLVHVAGHHMVQQYLLSVGLMDRAEQLACLREALQRCGPALVLDKSGTAVAWISKQERVKKQVEYYFSEKNLQKDDYLKGLIKASPGGWVAIKELLRWPRMLSLVEDARNTAAVCRALRDSLSVEVSNDGEFVRRVAIPRETSEAVRQQMEYYFSDNNLKKDKYLQGLIKGSAEGWVELKELMAWPNMKKLVDASQAGAVCRALEGSKVIELSSDRSAVRKITLKPNDHVSASVGSYNLPLPFSTPANNNEFSVMTWNLLADSMCTGTVAHTNVPLKYRKWEYRISLILRYIENSECDILCLQELNPHHYKELMACLKGADYTGSYSPKRGPGGSHVSGNRVLGNAVIWNRRVFESMGKPKVVAFAKEMRSECRKSGIGDTTTLRHYGGQQVAIICPLKHIRTDVVVLPAVTHITCNYENQDTQVAQVAVLLRQLQDIESTFSQLGHQCATILAGDFNAQPSSAVYKYISQGSLDKNEGCLQPQDPHVKQIGLLSGGVFHSLSLRSVYQGSEPKITTIRGHNGEDPGFSGCLDYIWYSNQNLRQVETGTLPDDRKLTEENTGGLPNSWCPSDHLPISARFGLS